MKVERRWGRYWKSIEVPGSAGRLRDVSAGIDLTGFCRPSVYVGWIDEDEVSASFTWALRGCDPGAHLYLSVVDPPRWLAWIADRRWLDR